MNIQCELFFNGLFYLCCGDASFGLKLLRLRRPFVALITDSMGTELFKVRKLKYFAFLF